MASKILFLTLLALFAIQAHGYKKFVAYKVSTSFFPAWQTCRLLGGHLATIESADENGRVETAIKAAGDIGKNWFIGGTDIGIEGRFVWIATSKEVKAPAYTNWNTGEPNNGGASGEDCMAMGYTGVNKWNDIPCDYKAEGFVCAFVY